MLRRTLAIAAVLLTAACTSTTAPAVSARASSTAAPTTGAATPTTATSPTSAAPSHAAWAPNITLATTAKQLPPGPFQITPISCGPYTAAEQNQFGTTAKGGLVYRFTDMSQSVTGTPSLTVNFLAGSNVLGSNTTGSNAPSISFGQSAEGHVDALDGSGLDLSFGSCELMEYALQGTSDTSSYAP